MEKHRFNCLDVLIALVSLLTLILDVGTDITVTVQFYRNEDTVWGSVMLVFSVVPLLVMNAFSLKWHATDRSLTAATLLLHLILLAPVHRYVRVIWLGLKSCLSGQPHFMEAALREQNDASILRLIETFLESAPQLVLQLYVMQLYPGHIYWIQGFSAASSLVSLAWALTAYCDTLRLNYQSAYQRRFLSLALHCCWQLLMVSARVTALVLFAAVFSAWIFLFAGLHWLVMTVWIWRKGTDFGSGKVERALFRIVCGFIYIFVFLNVHEGPTRSRITFYYCLLFSENAVLFAVWVIFGQPQPGMLAGAAVLVFGAFVLGAVCLMVYYRWLHPSGPIDLFSVGPTLSTSQHQGPQLAKEALQEDAHSVTVPSPSGSKGPTLQLGMTVGTPAKDPDQTGNLTLSYLLDSATKGEVGSVWRSGADGTGSLFGSSLTVDDCSVESLNTSVASRYSSSTAGSLSKRKAPQCPLFSVTGQSPHPHTSTATVTDHHQDWAPKGYTSTATVTDHHNGYTSKDISLLDASHLMHQSGSGGGSITVLNCDAHPAENDFKHVPLTRCAPCFALQQSSQSTPHTDLRYQHTEGEHQHVGRVKLPLEHPERQHPYDRCGGRVGGETSRVVSPSSFQDSRYCSWDSDIPCLSNTSQHVQFMDSFDSDSNMCTTPSSLREELDQTSDKGGSWAKQQEKNTSSELWKNLECLSMSMSCSQHVGKRRNGETNEGSTMNAYSVDELSRHSDSETISSSDSLSSVGRHCRMTPHQQHPGDVYPVERAPLAEAESSKISVASSPSQSPSKNSSSVLCEVPCAHRSPSPPDALTASQPLSHRVDAPGTLLPWRPPLDAPPRLEYPRLDPAPPLEHDAHFKHDPHEAVLELLMNRLQWCSPQSRQWQRDVSHLSPLTMSSLQESPLRLGRSVDLFDRRAWRHLCGSDAPSSEGLSDRTSRVETCGDRHFMQRAEDQSQLQQSSEWSSSHSPRHHSPGTELSQSDSHLSAADRSHSPPWESSSTKTGTERDRHHRQWSSNNSPPHHSPGTDLSQSHLSGVAANSDSSSWESNSTKTGTERDRQHRGRYGLQASRAPARSEPLHAIPPCTPQFSRPSPPPSNGGNVPGGKREGLHRYFMASDSPDTPTWNTPQSAPPGVPHHRRPRHGVTHDQRHKASRLALCRSLTPSSHKPLTQENKRCSVLPHSLFDTDENVPLAVYPTWNNLNEASSEHDSTYSESTGPVSSRKPFTALENSLCFSSSPSDNAGNRKILGQSEPVRKRTEQDNPHSGAVTYSHSRQAPQSCLSQPSKGTSKTDSPLDSPKVKSVTFQPRGKRYRQAAGRSADRRSASRVSGQPGFSQYRTKSADCLR